MEDHAVVTQLHGAVARYAMPERARQVISNAHLILLCGVTASGKNTLADYLVSHGPYGHVVSHTTRQPRYNHGIIEQSGVEYWFVSPAEMLDMVQKQAFVEVKAVHGETCYGTSIAAVEAVLAAQRHPIMEIDVQGALEFTQAIPSVRPIFILPPSYDVWMERLGRRGSISDVEKQKRLRSASMEIRTALDHPNFILTVNHEVELTADEIMRGVDTSEQTQTRNRELAEDLISYVAHL